MIFSHLMSEFPFLLPMPHMIFARRVFHLSLPILSAVILSYAAPSENLVAQGLLGSHFGVPGLNASFDYVIAGGGTAGLTLAKCLTESESVSVAVIEAGDF